MSQRGHELIAEYYDAALRAANAGYDDATALEQFREAFGALQAYIADLEEFQTRTIENGDY